MLLNYTMKMYNSIGLLNLTSTVNRKFLLGIIAGSALLAIMATVFRLMECGMCAGQPASGAIRPLKTGENCRLELLHINRILIDTGRR